MKPRPIDESFRAIEHHIRRAQAERAVFIAEALAHGIVAIARATTRLATRFGRARPARLATR